MTKTKTTRRHRFALGYINPTLEHKEDGELCAAEFFATNPAEDPTRQVDLKSLKQGGVRLAVLSHGNNDPKLLPGTMGLEYAIRGFTAMRRAIDGHSRHCRLVETRSDLRSTKRQMGILLHLTGAPLNQSIQNLEALFYLGVRAIHPFLNQSEVGGFANSGEPGLGLTPFGRRVIAVAHDLRMIVDLAHANDRSFREALKVCCGPVINSHTACRRLPNRNPERCSTDAQIKAIAATGGVVGVHFGSIFLWRAPAAAAQAREEAMQKMHKEIKKLKTRYPDPHEFLAHRMNPARWPEIVGGSIRQEPVARAPLDDLVNHIMHMLDLVGENHVALGSDYSLSDLCSGVTNVRNLPRLAKALESRGVRGAALEKVLWKNWERVFRQILPA